MTGARLVVENSAFNITVAAACFGMRTDKPFMNVSVDITAMCWYFVCQHSVRVWLAPSSVKIGIASSLNLAGVSINSCYL